MKVEHRILFIISMALLAGFCYSATSRLLFLARAERGVGVVRELRAENSVCGKRRATCTKFFAAVELRTSGGLQLIPFNAGYVRNHDQPLWRAVHHVGDRVPLVFDPDDPEAVHRDNPGDLWGFSFVLLVLQIITLVASLQMPEFLKPAPPGR